MSGELRTGWSSRLTRVGLASLLFLVVSGLVITFAPFHAAVQWTVFGHTIAGLFVLIPLVWYSVVHWLDYRRYNLSDVVLLGYVGVLALVVCLASGLVVTWQGLVGVRMSPVWRNVHLVSTFVVLGSTLIHAVLVVVWKKGTRRPAARTLLLTTVGCVIAFVPIGALVMLYGGPQYENRKPDDYSFVFGEDRPFAPSLATTESGGFYDAESLAGSESCGSAGCHTEILEEWQPSAHRYAAMDPLFQKVQSVMAEQNGAESTRYCGGCHDPISLFSGAKNVFADNLTELHGFNEGISCLGCHGVRETDLQGNADYVMTQPSSYLWQWGTSGWKKRVSDFLIRTYPDEHLELSKRMFKAPEYCAACHKQFIDEEVNRVGWVQLQNQYDNWKASHWYVEGDPEATIECRECHMPLVESTDPARGDSIDYNRSADDGKHRSHRFVAANTLVPKMLELEGWEHHVELTEQWLRGTFEIAEIQDKWGEGPVVELALDIPKTIEPGAQMPVRVVMTANKVGHDFPTGPLDIIQAWVELHVYAPGGEEIFSTGTRDENHFIEPGSFLFKAEPVDQFGNLIDRHNLWEMVGVRYRRALFPGYSDTVEFLVDCPTTVIGDRPKPPMEYELEALIGDEIGNYEIVASLMYRKVDQYLINFLLGEDSGLTAPVVEMTRVAASVEVSSSSAAPTTAAGSIGG